MSRLRKKAPIQKKALTEGQKYRVVFIGAHNKKEMVAHFLEVTEQHYIFDLRPLAGTQYLNKLEVIEIYETYNNVSLMMPRTYHGEVRVL